MIFISINWLFVLIINVLGPRWIRGQPWLSVDVCWLSLCGLLIMIMRMVKDNEEDDYQGLSLSVALVGLRLARTFLCLFNVGSATLLPTEDRPPCAWWSWWWSWWWWWWTSRAKTRTMKCWKSDLEDYIGSRSFSATTLWQLCSRKSAEWGE